jgi:hypothetical protein
VEWELRLFRWRNRLLQKKLSALMGYKLLFQKCKQLKQTLMRY